jgi:hypothetical protein
MPNRALEEENIDRNLAHFQQHGQNQTIQEWRQRIEDGEARSAGRPPRTIKVEEAVFVLRESLLTETRYSKSAQDVFRKLISPAHPKLRYVDLAQALVDRPADPSPEVQAYLAKYEQLEKDQSRWDVELSDEQRLQWDSLVSKAAKYKKRADEAQDDAERRAWKELAVIQKEAWWDLVNEAWEKWADGHPDSFELMIDQFLGKRENVPIEPMLLPSQHYYKGHLFIWSVNLILKRCGLRDEIATEVTEHLSRHLHRTGGVGNWRDVVGEKVSRMDGLSVETDEHVTEAGPQASKESHAKDLAYRVQAGRAYMNFYKHIQSHGVAAVDCLEAYLRKIVTNLSSAGELGLDSKTISFQMDDSTDADDENPEEEAENAVYTRSEHRQSQEQDRTQSVVNGIWFRQLLRVLTPRQIEVLALLEQGLTHEEIGEKTQKKKGGKKGVGPKTIQRELNAIAQSIRQAGLDQL